MLSQVPYELQSLFNRKFRKVCGHELISWRIWYHSDTRTHPQQNLRQDLQMPEGVAARCLRNCVGDMSVHRRHARVKELASL